MLIFIFTGFLSYSQKDSLKVDKYVTLISEKELDYVNISNSKMRHVERVYLVLNKTEINKFGSTVYYYKFNLLLDSGTYYITANNLKRKIIIK